MAKNQFENVIKKFDEFSYYVDGKIARGIEENRKGQFALVFKDKNGKLLENVRVKASLLRHEFNFGANLFYLDHHPTRELCELYKTPWVSNASVTCLKFENSHFTVVFSDKCEHLGKLKTVLPSGV